MAFQGIVPSLIFVLLVASGACAQDTLKVMHYNLMNYGNNTQYCDASNNNLTDKDDYLKLILNHQKPHLFTANELGTDTILADRILANALNIGGNNHYRRVPYSNGGSGLVNALFYDARRLRLIGHEKVDTALDGSDLVRRVDIHSFFYRDHLLETTGDTIFLHVANAHLKAGSDFQNQEERDKATEAFMVFIRDHFQPGNFLLCGDLNLTASSEQAFLNLSNSAYGPYRFFDPAGEPGNWHDNSGFASVHTQSTHNTTACPIGGGMDDRYDFILQNTHIEFDSSGIRSVPGSYSVVGQGGNSFNDSLPVENNTVVPTTIARALYEMSDHLPVTLKLRVDAEAALGAGSMPGQTEKISVVNPFHNRLTVYFEKPPGDVRVELYSIRGRKVFARSQHVLGRRIVLGNFSGMPAGMYIVRIQTTGQAVHTDKVFKR